MDGAGASDAPFVPPFPERLTGRLPPLELLRRFRRDMLSV